MNKRLHLSLIAAIASLLAAAQLITVFATFTYLFYTALIIIMVAGASIAVRALRGPLWAQVLGMAAMLLISLTWFFRSGSEIAGLIPTAGTFEHFADLFRQAGDDIAATAPPVPDRPGLLFIASVGLGVVALLIDVFAVGMRRPALAGLPILAIYAVPVAIKDAGLPFVPFMLGAAGFLWLLMTDSIDRVRRFGRRFTGDGRDIDLWEPSPLASAGRRLAFVGVSLSIVLTAILPGTTSGLIDRLGTGAGGGVCSTTNCKPGGNISVNLFSVLEGQLRQSNTVQMVVVTTNDPAPYYLRLAEADQAGPDGFTFRPPTGGQPVNSNLDPGLASGQEYQATIEITNLQMNLLPIYTQPTKMTGLSNSWSYDSASATVYSKRETSKGKKYTVSYIRPEFTRVAMNAAQALDPSDPIQVEFTKIPSEPFVKSEVDRTLAPLGPNATQYEKASALFTYFRESNGFRYDLQTQGGTSGAKITNFLKSKVGFCEQYAASLAWLARTAGLPARVAFGFTRGNGVSAGAYHLTNLNLHAWTEIYFSGLGWIPFDATPSLRVPGSIQADYLDSLRDQPGPSGPQLTDDTGKPNASGGGPLPGDDKQPNADGGNGGSTPAEVISKWPTWVAFGGAVILLGLLTPTMIRRRLRNQRKPKLEAVAVAADGPGPRPGVMTLVPDDIDEIARQDAHQAWDELLDTMVDFHIDPDPADSPRTTIERLVVRAELYPEVAKSGRRLGLAEERARYARTSVTDIDLGEELSNVRAGILEQATRSARWMAMLAPRSVLLRWRAASSLFATRVINGSSNVLDTTVRLLSPRRYLGGLLSRRANS